jgi:hypothetical protein
VTGSNPYTQGRADWAAGTPSTELWIDSPEYRAGMADQRTADVDAELIAAAGRPELAHPGYCPDCGRSLSEPHCDGD